MKFSTLLTILCLPFSLAKAGEPHVEMHRVQATTRDDSSGWYLAESTRGSFSVLTPIPFNDYTITDKDAKPGPVTIHMVGGKSPDGLKFSATKTSIIEGKTPTDLTAFAESFRTSDTTVSDVDPSSFDGNPSVSFSAKNSSSGAFFRCVKTPHGLFLVTLEFPVNRTDAAVQFKNRFLGSLKIKKTEPAVPR